jgi:hypothetical protein
MPVRVGGIAMLTIENLLMPGSTELPDCRCGAEMRFSKVRPCGDTEIRIYRCDNCQHEFQLMAWGPVQTQDRSI